jgi:hypothetical protein
VKELYLNNLVLKSSYESGVDNLVEDFYVPVLSCAIAYDRIAGFFFFYKSFYRQQGPGKPD